MVPGSRGSGSGSGGYPAPARAARPSLSCARLAARASASCASSSSGLAGTRFRLIAEECGPRPAPGLREVGAGGGPRGLLAAAIAQLAAVSRARKGRHSGSRPQQEPAGRSRE
eukprot:10384402-Lingulodinium_polyedra.AAC.1